MNNPLLSKETWDLADMAVAQDWELERGNEGELIWNSLGPELARMVCENPGVLGLLGGVVVDPRTGAMAEGSAAAWVVLWMGVRAGVLARVRVEARSIVWAKARVLGRIESGTCVWANNS